MRKIIKLASIAYTGFLDADQKKIEEIINESEGGSPCVMRLVSLSGFEARGYNKLSLNMVFEESKNDARKNKIVKFINQKHDGRDSCFEENVASKLEIIETTEQLKLVTVSIVQIPFPDDPYSLKFCIIGVFEMRD
jgi:hypothetical protein